ncbi:MAG: clostripain-related cysteine peptidase [Phocaeicola sp.]
MRYILTFLLGNLLFWGCSSIPEIPTDNSIPEIHVDKSVWGYFIANNTLVSDLRGNVADLAEALGTMKSSGEVLIYWDAEKKDENWPTPCILRYRTAGDGLVNGKVLRTRRDRLVAAEIVKEYPSQIATDKRVLASVVQDMKAYSSDSSYSRGITFGSHGSGWLKHIDGSNSRSLGPDGDLVNSITIPDLVEALQVAEVKFDFLLLDACMMAGAEVFYDLRKVADYVIASVIDVPGYGFSYARSLPHLMGFTADSYRKACETYINYYTDNPLGFGTISLVKCSEMESLAAAVSEQIRDNTESIGTYDNSSFQFYGRAPSFKLLSADLIQFIRSLNGGDLPADFKEQFNKTVLYTDYVRVAPGSKYYIDGDNYSGMGIYLPMRTKLYWNEYFQGLDWYKAAGWDAVTWPLPQ